MKLPARSSGAHRVAAWGWLILVPLLQAHDLYLYPSSFTAKPGTNASIAMHNGDAFPRSDGPPVFDRVKDAVVIHSSGIQPLRNLRKVGTAGMGDYTVPTGSYAVAMRTAPNFIGLDPTQFEGYLNHEKLDWVIRWRVDNREFAKDGRELYSKHCKALMNLDRDDFALKPVGHTAEIVLLENPAKSGAGSTVAVQVLFRGKPVEKQSIEASWSHNGRTERYWVGETNHEGKLMLKLRSAGAWKLHTIIMERSKQPEQADWESFWASVSFAVPGKGR